MNSKKDITEKRQVLLEMVGSFCAQELDDEYYQLCEKLVKKLGIKRDVPFKWGRLEIWAAAIVYAIGSINSLFDKSFKPYITPEQICEYFGTKDSTVSNRARQIKRMFDLSHFNPEFSTQKMITDNVVMVDGFMVPLNTLALDLQEMVKDAREKGKDIEFQTQQS